MADKNKIGSFHPISFVDLIIRVFHNLAILFKNIFPVMSKGQAVQGLILIIERRQV